MQLICWSIESKLMRGEHLHKIFVDIVFLLARAAQTFRMDVGFSMVSRGLLGHDLTKLMEE